MNKIFSCTTISHFVADTTNTQLLNVSLTAVTSEMEHRSLWVTEKEREEWQADGGLAKIFLLTIKSCYTTVMVMIWRDICDDGTQECVSDRGEGMWVVSQQSQPQQSWVCVTPLRLRVSPAATTQRQQQVSVWHYHIFRISVMRTKKILPTIVHVNSFYMKSWFSK